MHLTILFGGFLVMFTGSSVIGLILLIVLKTFVDVKSHMDSTVRTKRARAIRGQQRFQ